MSFLDLLFPIELIIKVVVIIILGIVTAIGAYIIPRGKLFVIAGGIIAILVVWFIDLEIHL